MLAVTSQAASELPKMRKASGYTGETIVDPENLLAKELKRRNVINVAISDHDGYPHGMVQPAVLALNGQDRKVLYEWAIVPSLVSNFLSSALVQSRLEELTRAEN